MTRASGQSPAAPCPALASCMVPPMRRASSMAMARPRPAPVTVPLRSKRWNGLPALAALLGGKAHAAVAEGDDAGAFVEMDIDAHDAALGGVGQGIGQQIGEDAAHGAGIGAHLSRLAEGQATGKCGGKRRGPPVRPRKLRPAPTDPPPPRSGDGGRPRYWRIPVCRRSWHAGCGPHRRCRGHIRHIWDGRRGRKIPGR